MKKILKTSQEEEFHQPGAENYKHQQFLACQWTTMERCWVQEKVPLFPLHSTAHWGPRRKQREK